jgi:hypothetical protein
VAREDSERLHLGELRQSGAGPKIKDFA